MATKKKGGRKSSSRKSSRKSSRSSGRKAAKKGGRKSTRRKSSGKKRTPNAAFMKPMQPSSDLAAVVGSGAMPRTEVTKKLWGYIKRKGLQDQKNRRMINADENLRPIFGRSQVSMFEMTRLVNKHLRNT
ncbi:MAG TPA: SWIB/MDM2 domain-containing protein [Gemmatimonadaceae bacterium]|jgi:chromatin remodeling complex protein RSC6|nr:SWIB/MDM2 domain-containing protein [Gemmatimonadaceae bacterium]